MVSHARAGSPARIRIRARSRASGLGVAPFAFSVALAIDAAVAATGSLFLPHLLRGPAVSIGSLEGTALAILGIALPVLIVSMWLADRGSARALLTWFGAASYLAYQGVLFLFGTPFNSLFFPYLGLLSLGIWSVVVLLIRLDVPRLAGLVDERLPVRTVAAYLVVGAVVFFVMWLRAIVPAVLSSNPPAFLEGTGMTTGPGQIIDLGFALPLAIVVAAWLLQRRPWGYVLAGGLVAMLTIETASIALDQWFGAAIAPTSTLVSAALVPAFGVVTAIGLATLVLFLRGFGADPGAGSDVDLDLDIDLPGSRRGTR